jgi:hypothetical protein
MPAFTPEKNRGRGALLGVVRMLGRALLFFGINAKVLLSSNIEQQSLRACLILTMQRADY